MIYLKWNKYFLNESGHLSGLNSTTYDRVSILNYRQHKFNKKQNKLISKSSNQEDREEKAFWKRLRVRLDEDNE